VAAAPSTRRASPIRPLAVAAKDHAQRAPERDRRRRLPEAPAMFLGRGPRRSDAAALAMGHGE